MQRVSAPLSSTQRHTLFTHARSILKYLSERLIKFETHLGILQLSPASIHTVT